jgi:hypothetical protein
MQPFPAKADDFLGVATCTGGPHFRTQRALADQGGRQVARPVRSAVQGFLHGQGHGDLPSEDTHAVLLGGCSRTEVGSNLSRIPAHEVTKMRLNDMQGGPPFPRYLPRVHRRCRGVSQTRRAQDTPRGGKAGPAQAPCNKAGHQWDMMCSRDGPDGAGTMSVRFDMLCCNVRRAWVEACTLTVSAPSSSSTPSTTRSSTSRQALTPPEWDFFHMQRGSLDCVRCHFCWACIKRPREAQSDCRHSRTCFYVRWSGYPSQRARKPHGYSHHDHHRGSASHHPTAAAPPE